MEAYFYFRSDTRLKKPKHFKFISESGSEWTLTFRWHHYTKDAYISIRKSTAGRHKSYVADLEVFTDLLMPVCETHSTGTWKGIKICIELNKFLNGLHDFRYDNPEVCIKQFWKKKLMYKVKLYPVLELKTVEMFQKERSIEDQGRQNLLRDITSMFNDPGFSLFKDLVICSSDVEVKVHKNILSARLPEICETLNEFLERRKPDGMQVVRVPDPAGPGLLDVMQYLYTSEYSENLLQLSNMCTTARVMAAETLHEMFLDECVKKISIGNALYVIYLTNLNQIEEFHRKSMDFLLSNFDVISCTAVWKWHEVFFIGLNRANKKLTRQFSLMQIMRFSLYMLAKIFYGQ